MPIRLFFEPLESFWFIALFFGGSDGGSNLFILVDSIWVEFNNPFVIESKELNGTEVIVLNNFLSSMIVFIFGLDVFIREDFIDSFLFILEDIKVVLLIDILEVFLGYVIDIFLFILEKVIIILLPFNYINYIILSKNFYFLDKKNSNIYCYVNRRLIFESDVLSYSTKS